MVDGLALRRAANAAQAQAASTNNTTPVHSEDLQLNEILNRRRGGATSGSLFNGGSWAGWRGEEVVVDMRAAEAGLATVRQVVETRQLANIGMFNGEPLARKAGNLTMKSARTRRATLSLYKALVSYRCLLLYRCLLHRHDSPASALPKY